MYFWNEAEALHFLSDKNIRVNRVHEDLGYKSLGFASAQIKKQESVGCSPDIQACGVGFYLDACKWLGADSLHVMWIEYLETSFTGLTEILEVMKVATGYGADISTLCAIAIKWSVRAQDDPEKDEILFAWAFALMCVSGSNGWVLSQSGEDRIAFWEGNLFFHSASANKLAEASKLIDVYSVSRELI